MNATPELVALIQREREVHIREEHLARLARIAQSCCDPTLLMRLARTLRGTPATC